MKGRDFLYIPGNISHLLAKTCTWTGTQENRSEILPFCVYGYVFCAIIQCEFLSITACCIRIPSRKLLCCVIRLFFFADGNCIADAFPFYCSVESIVIIVAVVGREKNLYCVTINGKLFCSLCISAQFSTFRLIIIVFRRLYGHPFIQTYPVTGYVFHLICDGYLQTLRSRNRDNLVLFYIVAVSTGKGGSIVTDIIRFCCLGNMCFITLHIGHLV